jgi:hypothetical protein
MSPATGSEVPPGDLPQRLDLELLVGDDPLQPLVLLLQLPPSLGVVGLHPAVLVLPPVLPLLGHLQVPAHGGDVLGLVQQLVRLSELSDDLVGGVPPSRHCGLNAMKLGRRP